MNIKEGVTGLEKFVGLMLSDGIKDPKQYTAWAKTRVPEIETCFGYNREPGMPPVYTLVRPFFHPKLPLIGLNYTQSAHNTLHQFSNGWTNALRLCRGIILDETGKLIALPFPKFFNYGEHPETQSLPNEPFEIGEKYDGHLGIIFEYRGEILITSRGDFESPTSNIGRRILKNHLRENPWSVDRLKEWTVLVEIIHPDTEVYIEYAGDPHFVIIGAYNREECADLGHAGLVHLGRHLNLPVVRQKSGCTIDELIEHMKDRSVSNQEGYVVRFENGKRVKFKFQTYIGKMVADKLNYRYLMQRYMDGKLETMLNTLPEEIYGVALRMLGEITLATSSGQSPREKYRKLYGLVPEDECTSHFKTVCRKFIASITKTP